jgi:hypothetical protein
MTAAASMCGTDRLNISQESQPMISYRLRALATMYERLLQWFAVRLRRNDPRQRAKACNLSP